jgi:RHS repeat-associated protein
MRSPMQRSMPVLVPLFERKTRLNSKATSRSARWRGVFAAALVFIFGAAAHAQQSTVTFGENFQSYGKSKKPAGWIDTKVGSLNAKPRGYYKTRIDPTQDKNGTNIVYGTTKSIADKVIGGVNRGGYFAVYQPKVFSAIGRFEVTGRMIRISERSRAGLTVLNGYPEKDKYYLIREESTGTAAPTLRLSAFGAGTPTGKLDSGITLTSGKWYQFRIATDSVAGVTNIRARFWLAGTAEPSTYAIDATDSSPARLVAGRFGVWAGGTDKDLDADAHTPSTEATDDDDETLPPTRGTYVDDLNLKSPADTGAPTIQFYENGVRLDPTKRTDFGRDAAIDIRIADDLSTHSYVATLGGAPYRSLDSITAEGIHVLKVRATDAVGNFTDAEISILIDKTKPTITLLESGQPLADNTKFKRTAAVEIRVADTYSTYTTIAKLGASSYNSLDPIAAEGAHVLFVEATDAVGNKQTRSVHLVIDLTLPVITFFESGQSVDSSNAKFKTVPKIEIRANEPGTIVTATLDGNPYTSETPIPAEGRHVIVATATDEAGNVATGTLNLLVDTVKPVVVLRESSIVLDPTKMAVFGRDAAIAITITDATSEVESSAKLNGADYTSGASITQEQTHTLTIHAVDETGNVTDVTLSVLIDKTAPVVSFFNGETRLDARTDYIFDGNVSIDIKAADADPDVKLTAKLDGLNYQPKTEIAAEGQHAIVVTATDVAGNVATVDVTLRFVIDKSTPVIVLTETGTATPETLSSGSQVSYNRDAKVTIVVTDNDPGLKTTSKLDGSDYTSGAAITTDGSHTLTVHAVDSAGNEADATVTLVIDQTRPVIRFFHGDTELLASVEKHKFKELPAIDIRVADEQSIPTTTSMLNGVPYTKLTPVPEGIHTLTVRATDGLKNVQEATLKLLVDLTAPVIVLREGTNLLPLSGTIFNRNLDVSADVDDLSTPEVTSTLDGTEVTLPRRIAEDGPHTLSVTATDELGWPATVTSTFIIDTTKPVVKVLEGTSELYEGRSFARDVTLTATDDDITTVEYTATLDGAPYTLGTLITANGTHTIVVFGTDAAGNKSDPLSLTFHIERGNPEVIVKESGESFPAAHSFKRDIVATIVVNADTNWSSDVKIDGVQYDLGTPYGVEGTNHKLVVVVTTVAGNSTRVEIPFEIDKTPPTIRLLANGAPMTNAQTFVADFTPVVEAADTLTDPPTVVITLDGQTLEAGTVISEEKKQHTISATATDRAKNSTTAGPFTFSLDKSDPTVTVMVDGKPLENGAKFKTPITPVIKAEDVTTAEITATLDNSRYTLETPISGDGSHTLVVTAVDPFEHDTVETRTFTIDTTAPIVTVVESINGVDEPFVTGAKYKRKVAPDVRVVDTTSYLVTATLDGNSYNPGDDIISEGEHELLVIVTDEMGWITPVPAIKFTIDTGNPVIKVFDVYETKEPLVSGKTFKRDVKPLIEVTDATDTDVVATLNGQTFRSEDLVSTDGRYTLIVNATDELGHPGTIDPISFVIDKTAPVVVITEDGKTFADGALLNHDAVPLAGYTDLTDVTFTATMDGISYRFGTPVTGEGPHTLIWSAVDAMGWATPEATIRFVIDKTAPVVTITHQGAALAPKTYGHTVTPVIGVDDRSHTTTVAKIDGLEFHSGDAVSAEGSHTLAVTVTDDAGWPTVVPPITFVIDKTKPGVRVLESGVDFVGKNYNRPVLPQIVVDDATGTTIVAKLGEAVYTPDTLIEAEGTQTLSVTVTDDGGNFTIHPPITFLIDRTAPVVTITEAGAAFTGGAFKRSVKPEIKIQDITPTTTVATLNGEEFHFGAEITAERRYALSVTVTDDLGWPTVVPTIGFAIDMTPPIVELVVDGKPLEDGALFNHPVEPRAIIEDVTDTTVTATLNGADYILGTPITAEGDYTLDVRVVDEVDLPFVVPTVKFRIDTTKPVISIISPANQQTLASPRVLVTGNSDDAVTVEVNGVVAEIDPVTKRFTVPSLELLEGPNTIVAIGTDAAGNVSDPVSVEVLVDTRAPEVTIASPVANACLTTRQVQVSGAIADPNVASVSVAILPGTAPAVTATLSADKRSWNATLQFPSEGKFVIAVTARDHTGHEAVATVQVRIDETRPRIEITESGAPFVAPFVNRTVAPFVRAVDADPNTILTVTLDGAAYVSGTPIAAEKSYELKATATDCAGHKADDVIVRFTIDKTPPQFVALSPANGASIGTLPAVGGTVSPDTLSVIVEETGAAATVSNGSFSFPALAIEEGSNRFSLVAVDRAGNATRVDYSFNVKTSAPTVSIVENGSAIVSGTRYSRAVKVDVVSNEAAATVTATHNGQPFTSGTTISNNGSHTISATARDSFGHTSPVNEVTFTIDHEGPVVTITEPVDGATVTADTIRVRGTVTGDPVSATINGVPLPLNGGAFDAQVALEIGANDIAVIALDAAGNSGVGRIEVTRGGGTLGLILTSPIGSQPTNRRTTTVAGQVLSPAGVSFVTVNAIQVPIDAAGAFRKTDFPLTEGQNVITATVRKDGAEGSVSVTVTADFTPPAITVRESGNALEDEARFATQAQITVTATDAGQSVTPTLLIDAAPAVSPVTVSVNGGHTLIAIARDLAGNETRVERTFFIGGGATGGCALSDFDPADGALVTADHVTLIGRTGGAPGVKVNGTAAVVSNGSFSATVNLPAEGANAVTITCTDANGNATGAPKTITLTRVTGAPSIDITEPAHNSVTANEVITVRGTIAGEVSQVVVNGSAATITGNTFVASNVRLSSGVNVVVARAKNAAGRTASDSVHVTWLKNSPTITITSPTTALTVRTATLDVSGVWTNLDPASLTVTRGGSAAAVQTEVTSDTTGTFVAASVPLTTGLQTITVRGLDRLGRATEATINVTRAEGKPSIVITEPADNTYYGSGAGATFTVTGTFNAETAATVEVNGENATLDGSTFTATVPFSSLVNTPVVARVTELTGTYAIDTVRVSKLGAAPTVVQTFPDADAVDVDPGTLPLVLFSAAMDRASVRTAFRLENAAGTAVSGDVVLDRDVLTFAPAALLTPGERFTMRIATTAKDLAGNALAAAFSRSFTVAATAPVTAPTLNAYASRVCGSLELSGTAPPNVRVRIDLGTLTFNTTASATGAFSFTLPLSGRSGFQVARVRVVGSDGSLSTAAEAQFEVDCAGPQVTNATYDRGTNALTITFSKAINVATVTTGAAGSVRLQLTDGTIVSGAVSALAAASGVSIVPAQDLTEQSFTLTVTTAILDTRGTALTAPYSRAFTIGEPTLGDGAGYISGEVFDADTGRPLPGASVSIDVPLGAFARPVGTQSAARSEEISATAAVVGIADNRGRYLRELPEGAHTIRASADDYTTVWRQIIVRTGSGVIPTDIRLTPRGVTKSGNGAALVLNHGGAPATPLALPAELRIPAGMIASGNNVTLTSVGAQSLAGLLPLGWSPLASAEIVSNASSLSGAELEFTVPAQSISSASQTLTAVRYFDDRDEWRVVLAVVPIDGDKAKIPVSAAGAYALVYADKDPRLAKPAAPVGGGALPGVADPCLANPNPCAPLAAKEALQLVPPVVLPTQRTVATLRIKGDDTSLFPSGTAVQAYVDEELRLADGTRDVVAPFATDLLLYRNLAGDTGEAVFHLAPSARASEVVLEVGYDHIRIVPYPERLDRGALIGREGGRVPADDRVAVEIPAGATTDALSATAVSIQDFSPYGTIPGYRIVGGLALALQWAGQGTESSPVELIKPARATFTVTETNLPSQLVLVEMLEGTQYGRIFRLASQITALDGGTRFSTRTIDRAVLPVDGIIREGRYLLLAPNAPIAFATGTVHMGVNGPAVANARVLTPPLGVIDLTRVTGIFNVPVPAAMFSLIPRTVTTGDGAAYDHPSVPAVDAVVNVGALSIVAQPPTVTLTVLVPSGNSLNEVTAEGATGVATNTSVKASFSPGVDPASVAPNAIVVLDDENGNIVPGRSVAQGSTGILWTLEPGTRLNANATYTAIVSPNVLGTNGTPVGTVSATFATVDTLSSPNVDPSKIRITMPDANGRANIIGAAGALTEGWNAVAVRRFRDFSNRPQDTANGQRSFLIELGTGTDPLNRVTFADEIYLQIINPAGSVAAIVQLGPFTTEDGRGFVAPAGKAITFTTPDNVTVAVPAEAFDVPTVVRVDPAAKAVFEDVPGFNEELSYLTGFKVDFEGVARKRLDITFPTPASLPADKTPFLGMRGMSSQGPRIMLIDLLRRDGGNLTTNHPEGSSVRGISVQSAKGVKSDAIVNPTVLRDMLLGIDRGALIIGFTFQTSVSFITFAPPPHPPDFFIPPVKSIYYASFAAERDRILVPVATDGAFSIVGVDPGTGLETFNAPFTALQPGEPTSPTEVTLPSTNDQGPYPVFTSPGRTETLEITGDDYTDESIRNIKATINGNSVTFSNGATALAADTHVEVLNLRSGNVVTTDNFASSSLSMSVEQGDRLMLLISEHDVDPNVNVTVVFSEPIDATNITQLREQFKLLSRDPSISGSTFQPVPGQLDIRINSGGRRISVIHSSGYQRGKIYRLLLAKEIGDGEIKLGKRASTPPATAAAMLPDDLHVDFSIRAPKGLLDTFNISSGSVRDLALMGNILFISATDGGIFAYDASNPLMMGSAPAFAHIAPPVGSGSASWALAADGHGRLYATAVTPMYGVVRSYREEDFTACGVTGTCPDPMPVIGAASPTNVQRGNAIIAWRTGINVGMPLASLIVGGWPEAIPRKIKVVTRDAEPEDSTFEDMAGGGTPVGNGFYQKAVTLTSAGMEPYDRQRVTVLNVTRDYRWSLDVGAGLPSTVTIFGQPKDEMRVIRNLSTVGVVSLFGFGLGIYDLNAVDANFRHVLDPSWERLEDTYATSDGKGSSADDCKRADEAIKGRSCEIGSLNLSPDTAVTLIGDKVSISVLEQNRGFAHLTIEPPNIPGVPARYGRLGSMVFAEKILGLGWFGHPRINQLRRLYSETPVGRVPTPRYLSADTFKRDGKTYALITAFEYGLMVVRLDGALKASSLVDVVWIPAGAQSVRVAATQDLAVVVDGKGRALLINLAGLDESAKMAAELPCASMNCEWALFPTAKAAIEGVSAGGGDVGADDPRIVWKSPDRPVTDPLVFGTIPPIFDGETGFLYTGNVLEKKMRVISAVDPRLRFVGQTGLGASPTSLKLLDRIVPMGIKPPAGSVAGDNGSLAAFRLQTFVPGSMDESPGGTTPAPIVVDTERVLGVASAQTPEPLPRSRFRQTGPRPVTTFTLLRDAPEPSGDPNRKKLRYQRGWNRMVSPWIVAIADPRASKDYVWPSGAGTKEEEGCYSCDRPDHLEDRNEPEVFELYTAGRYISAYPTAAGLPTDWEWLTDARRLNARVNTVMADTVRPIPVLVAAQAPPVAGGMLQETTYVHSGEVETSSIDFDAGGRAGWNVVVDRAYRSRTLYESPMGAGWDSSLFRRLRQLPNNDVEYRDGAEVWTFRPAGGGTYTSPAGLAVSLRRIDLGWTLIDQKFRIVTFDELGRIVRESDEFFKPSDPKSGNVIRYGYNGDGLLSSIVDPVGRATKLTYYADSTPHAGLLQQIEDWHDSPRFINFEYDADRRLTKVKLPDVVNTSSARPEKSYTYTPAGSSYNDKVELRTNLEKVFDPNGVERVKFDYGTSGVLQRDRVTKQTWGTGETAEMSYSAPTTTSVTDVLGQSREYTFTKNTTDLLNGLGHVDQLKEVSVPVWTGASFGQLPATVSAGAPSTSPQDRVWTYSYANGMQTGVNLAGVSNTTIGYNAAPNGAGSVISSTTTAPTGAGSGPAWMPVNAAVTRTFEYQPEAPTFLKAITAGGKRVEMPEAHRSNINAVAAANDSINQNDKYEKTGLLKETSSTGGTDTSSAGAGSRIEYFPETAPKHARSLPQFVYEGTPGNELVTEFKYPTDSQTIEINSRGVETTTEADTWGRPIKVEIKKSGDPLVLETRYEYDAAGRAEKVTQRKTAGGDVVRTTTFDAMGRIKALTTSNVATVGTATTTLTYNLGSRKIDTLHPGGATTTIEFDKLGRAVVNTTHTGSSPIEKQFAYDLAGNRVFVTDMFIAAASAYDSNHRLIATRRADGTITTVKPDGLGSPTEVKKLDGAAVETIAESSYQFSNTGRLQASNARVDTSTVRPTSIVWDGGGRPTGIAVADRATRSTYDIKGRAVMHASGAGSALELTEIFSKTEAIAYSGDLASTVKSTEKSGPGITTTLQRDSAGGVVQTNTGSLEWKHKYDEFGNVTDASAPQRASVMRSYDARGALIQETLPDGAQHQYAYDGSGAQTAYTDPTSQATSTTTDLIGRPTGRAYPDGTSEVIQWEGERLKSITDRQGRNQTFLYNAKGQLHEIRSGSAVVDRIAYDDAGRMVSWKTPDTEMVWGPEFDLEGRPKRTMQRRFKNGSGLTSSELLDEFEQRHVFNEHGERTFASMPVYSALTLGPQWTVGIVEAHDAKGNVTSISRATAPGTGGPTVMSATYRNAGRPETRTITTAGGGSILRTYTYDPATSLLTKVAVSNASGVIAGSEVTYDGLQKASAKLLGLSSGERHQHWSYDARGRVAASLYGVQAPTADPSGAIPGSARENLNPADFRGAHERTAQLDAATHSALQSKGIDPTKVEPPTVSFTEQAGHKIAAVTRGPQVRPFAYQGAERVDDGRFMYEFDVKGRLIRATEKSVTGPLRSIAYSYSGTGRLVGRRAEYSSSAVAPIWQLEDRQGILNLDGLPAETTFVWDPITDRLIAVFKAGATPATDAHGGLLKQIIHGDAAYDDPIETATIDPSTGNVTHLYPIYDEAASGSLQAIVNTTGEVIARNLSQDPYGAEDVALTGAAVDEVKIEVRKVAGNVDAVTVTLHSTEALLVSSVAAGARLATVDHTGALVRTATITPAIDPDDPFALRWTLTASQWASLIDSSPIAVGDADRIPVALSIGATPQLRASNWSSAMPVLPPPDWVQATRPVFVTAELAIEVREPMTALTALVDATGSDETRSSKLYEVDSLALLGSSGGADEFSEDILSARMHAHPFTEPMTRLNYVRARWFDPSSGSFLSPDPMGYQDSANLYAFAGGDPVNGRDPTGTAAAAAAIPLIGGGGGATAAGGGGLVAVGTTIAELAPPVAIGSAIVIGPFWLWAKYEEHLAEEAEAYLREVQKLNADKLAKGPIPRPVPVPAPPPPVPAASTDKAPKKDPKPKPVPPPTPEPMPPPQQKPTEKKKNPCEDVPPLDWSTVSKSGETRRDHVGKHERDNPAKPSHGVFFPGTSFVVTEEAWCKAHLMKIPRRKDKRTGSDLLTVPMGRQVGWMGGAEGSKAAVPTHSVEIVLLPGTNKLITSYPVP